MAAFRHEQSLLRSALGAACAVAVVSLSAATADPLDPWAITAGVFTIAKTDASAFAVPVAMLDAEQWSVFAQGKEQFNEAWVVAPEPNGVWGLGPTFNEDRCAHCHENNGRARAPVQTQEADRGYLIRVSIPGSGAHGAPVPHPVYGDQLQNRGIPGRVPAEAKVFVRYESKPMEFADGEVVALRQPKLEVREARFGELGDATMLSPRIAPAMVGLGLLEAVPDETILALAKSQAERGVNGRPNFVLDVESEQLVIGRFGWKANQPNLRQQTAAAFHGDIGATTYMFPEENCPAAQTACLDVPSASKCGGQGGCTGNQYRPEVVPSRLTNITLYLQALAVPARRNVDDAQVKRGEVLFEQAKCSACHVPELRTGAKPALKAASNQVIRAYTDLLLHDMGEGLADGRPDFKAGPRDWRTAPLWGIGLIKTVNGHSDLLHDGRARDVTEAILWHGGEAEKSRESFRTMKKSDREALVKFVEAL